MKATISNDLKQHMTSCWFVFWRDWGGDNLVGPFPTKSNATAWKQDSLREGFGVVVKCKPPEMFK